MIRRLASNAALLLGVRTLSKVLVLAMIVLTQRALGPRGYGQFTLTVVLGSISGILADLGLQVVFVREASRERDRLGHLLGVTLAAKIPLAIAGGLLFLGLMQVFARGLMHLALPAYALVLVGSLGNVIRSCFFARDELRFEAVAIALETGMLVVGTVAARLVHTGPAGYLWAYTGSYAVPLAYATIVTRIRYTPIRLVWDHAVLHRITRQSLPFAFAFILNTLYFRIDTVILSQMRGEDQVGLYGAATKFIDGLTFIPQAVMNALFPALSVLHTEVGDALRTTYVRAYRVLAAMGMPVSVGLVVLAPAIVHYTGALEQSASSLRILGISMFFIFVVSSFLYVLGAMNRQRVFVVILGVSLVVNVVLNLIAIPLFPYGRGFDATSWTTVITEIILFAIGYIALVRAMGPFSWLRPIAPVLVSGAAMFAVMWPLQDHPFVDAVVGPVVYAGVMVLTGGISRGEIRVARELLGMNRIG
jgi:O-antigen/teichoic acid export membrane protein